MTEEGLRPDTRHSAGDQETSDGQTSRYRITYWKCVNWHNLMTQEGRVHGDVFNLGPNESGKTTWLDGVHAALTLGHPNHMEWNSAADPTMSRARLKEEGRSLSDVIFRTSMDGHLREKPTIVYFALELMDSARDQVYSVGVGAYATSPNADPNRWGFVIPDRLRNVDLTEPGRGGRVYDRSRLEDTHGDKRVMSVRTYRRELGELLYGSRERYDEVLDMLNLGKSYSRLAEKTSKFSDLFRRVLPPPHPQHFEDARADLRAINDLEESVASSRELLERLQEIQNAAEEIERQRALLARYEYREAYLDHLTALDALETAEEELESNKDTLKQAEQRQRELQEEHATQQEIVDGLSATEVETLVEKARIAKRELDRCRKGLQDAEKRLSAAKAEASMTEEEKSEAWGGVGTACSELSQDVHHLARGVPGWVPGEVPENLDVILQALQGVEQDSPSVPNQVHQGRERALDALQAEEKHQATVAERERERAERFREALEEKEQEIQELSLAPDIPPVEGLHRILEDIREDVFPLYQCLEGRDSRMASIGLFEAYLPDKVLGAIIPRSPEDVGAVREAVFKQAPNVKVVNTRDLPELEGGELDRDQLVDALDPDRTDDLALRYLVKEYGNVELLEEEEARQGHPRVVWKDGRVYDGRAWHLGVVPETPRFIGEESRRRSLELTRDRVEEERDRLRGRLEDHETASAEADDKANALAGIKETLARAFSTHKLLDRFRTFVQARLRHETKLEAGKREEEAVQDSAREVERREKVHEDLQVDVEERGADELYEKLQKAKEELEELAVAKDEAAEKVGAAKEQAKASQVEVENCTEAVAARTSERNSAYQKMLRIEGLKDLLKEKVEAHLQTRGFYETKKDNLRDLERKAMSQLGAKREEIQTLIVDISHKRTLDYDKEENLVTQSVSGRPLEELLDEIGADLEAEKRKLVEETRDLSQKVFVNQIATGLKQDVQQMEERLKEVNQQLKDAPFRGAIFQIKKSKVSGDQGIEQMRKLVLEASAESSSEHLAEFMRNRLNADTAEGGHVPRVFDYREWYEFSISRTEKRTDSGLRDDHLKKASGGGQAIPRYLFGFCLFRVLYDRISAHLRLVLIDEAFQRIDPGNIDRLIEFAKSQGLDLVVTNTELDGATAEMDKSTVHMFSKNDQEETFVEPWTREATSEDGGER